MLYGILLVPVYVLFHYLQFKWFHVKDDKKLFQNCRKILT